MNRRPRQSLSGLGAAVGGLAFLLSMVSVPHGCLQPADATRLPPDMSKLIQSDFGTSKPRLDGSLEATGGQIYLPLVPLSPSTKKGKLEQESAYPEGKTPDVVFYSNGWAYVRLLRKGEACTLALPNDLPERFKKKLKGVKFPSDLIVPQGFVVARSYKELIQDVSTVSLIDDSAIYSPDFGQKPKTRSKENYKGNGTVFLTSITAGSITMLDGKTLNKIAEFPTEGTPCSMDVSNGLVYIADQAKNRILIVDPVARKFKGQIDLPARSAPKGLVALPNGKWLYVSESGGGDVAAVETATGKVLVKTKTHPGPGRLAVTPDGVFLLVLNVTTGELTIISTYNQQVVSTVKVGDMPSSIVINNEGKLAYITNRMSNTVAVVDIAGHRVVNTIKCAQSPTGIALSNDNSKLYVASGRENSVTEFDTKTFARLHEVHTPPEVEFPGYLCLLPGGERLLVLSQQTDAVAILDTEKMEFDKNLTLGHANHEASWQPVP